MNVSTASATTNKSVNSLCAESDVPPKPDHERQLFRASVNPVRGDSKALGGLLHGKQSILALGAVGGLFGQQSGCYRRLDGAQLRQESGEEGEIKASDLGWVLHDSR